MGLRSASSAIMPSYRLKQTRDLGEREGEGEQEEEEKGRDIVFF